MNVWIVSTPEHGIEAVFATNRDAARYVTRIKQLAAYRNARIQVVGYAVRPDPDAKPEAEEVAS